MIGKIRNSNLESYISERVDIGVDRKVGGLFEMRVAYKTRS